MSLEPCEILPSTDGRYQPNLGYVMGFVRGNIVGIIMELSINGKSPSDPYVKLPEGIVHIYIL